MANLRVDKITSTETFETTGSVQFVDADSLQIAANSDFDFGTGDFTVEWWQYLNGPQNEYQTVLSINYGTNPNLAIQSATTTGTAQKVYVNGSSVSFTEESNAPLSTWVHYALVRNGSGSSNLKIYRDGVQTGQGTYSGDIGNSNITTFIGGHPNVATGVDLQGFISNLRIVKGTALYTSNFKPPMRELEVIPGTVLLACQSKTDATLEKTGKTITVNGNAVASELTPGLLTPIVKSGGGSAITGSVEFNGDGDYLQIVRGSNTDFEFGTQDFTIEFFAHFAKTGMRIMSTGDNGNYSTGGWVFETNNQFGAADSAGNFVYYGTFTYPTNSWAHISVVRNGSNIYGFVNGIQQWSNTITKNITFSGTNDFSLGTGRSGSSGVGDYNLTASFMTKGFISNLRVIKGTALYTHNFIPPTRELKKVPGTVLLCCQDPDNPLTEATGKTITGYGSLNQLYGTELAINGQFTADSDWTKGDQWTISGNSASITDSPNRTSDSFLTQDGSSWIQAGQMYRVAVDWSITTGDFDVRIGGNANLAKYSINSYYSSPYVFDIEAGATNTLLEIIANQHMVGSINSIRVDYAPPSKAGSNFTPQVGDDRKVTFEGVTKINSNAYFYFPTGNTESRTMNVATQASSAARGVFMGGLKPAAASSTDIIDFVTITSTGNAIDFGSLDAARRLGAACSSSTRGVAMGGFQPATIDTIQYVTIASRGNAADFGNLSATKHSVGGSANSTRGLSFGSSGRTNAIEYITIASTGNAQDFGDMIDGLGQVTGTSSPTRCVMASGESPTRINVMQYVTIMSMGNAFEFGDLTVARSGVCSFSSATRGVYLGGELPASPNFTNTVDFVNIASTGDAINFGDLDNSNGLRLGGTAATPTRGLYAGGGNDTPAQNTAYAKIHHFTIASTGDATDFGDLTLARFQIYNGTVSSGHGGLG